jgi:hypothetical protein
MNQPTDTNSETPDASAAHERPFQTEKSAIMNLLRAKDICLVEIDYDGSCEGGSESGMCARTSDIFHPSSRLGE